MFEHWCSFDGTKQIIFTRKEQAIGSIKHLFIIIIILVQQNRQDTHKCAHLRMQSTSHSCRRYVADPEIFLLACGCQLTKQICELDGTHGIVSQHSEVFEDSQGV